MLRAARLRKAAICCRQPTVRITAIAVVTATTPKKPVRQLTPNTACKGNSPAPAISSAAKLHMTKFRRGIAQVSSGL